MSNLIDTLTTSSPTQIGKLDLYPPVILLVKLVDIEGSKTKKCEFNFWPNELSL